MFSFNDLQFIILYNGYKTDYVISLLPNRFMQFWTFAWSRDIFLARRANTQIQTQSRHINSVCGLSKWSKLTVIFGYISTIDNFKQIIGYNFRIGLYLVLCYEFQKVVLDWTATKFERLWIIFVSMIEFSYVVRRSTA